MKVTIVSEEEVVRGAMKKIVEEMRNNNLKTQYCMPREVIWEIEEGKFSELYVLDADMRSMNLLEVTSYIKRRCKDVDIVFLSSSLKYCIQGYEYGIYRYIRKSEMETKLAVVLRKLLSKTREDHRKYYCIDEHSNIIKIPYQEILYLYVEGKYTYFKTFGQVYRERKTLKKVYEKLLEDTEYFLYANKGCIVNCDYILQLKDKNLLIQNGEVIPVSISKNQKIKEKIRGIIRGEHHG